MCGSVDERFVTRGSQELTLCFPRVQFRIHIALVNIKTADNSHQLYLFYGLAVYVK